MEATRTTATRDSGNATDGPAYVGTSAFLPPGFAGKERHFNVSRVTARPVVFTAFMWDSMNAREFRKVTSCSLEDLKRWGRAKCEWGFDVNALLEWAKQQRDAYWERMGVPPTSDFDTHEAFVKLNEHYQ